MENRERIEKIYELIKDWEQEHDWSDEYKFLYRTKEDSKKFNIKYDYLDKYGIDLKVEDIYNEESIKVAEKYARINIWRIKGEGNGRIPNSEKQPKNEFLMVYNHSTGSYMFGGGYLSREEYYDSELFNMYFEELKQYNYSYIDEQNHSIYFTVDEGFKLYKNYKDICEKYQKLFNERIKKAKFDRLKKELDKLGKENKNGNERN